MHKMVVLAKAVEGQKEELARWYDEQHMKDLLSVPGFLSAERHDIAIVKTPGQLPAWDFMLIYELAGEDPMSILRGMAGTPGAAPSSPALESAVTLSMLGLSRNRQVAG
jgi:hypothetical protein